MDLTPNYTTVRTASPENQFMVFCYAPNGKLVGEDSFPTEDAARQFKEEHQEINPAHQYVIKPVPGSGAKLTRKPGDKVKIAVMDINEATDLLDEAGIGTYEWNDMREPFWITVDQDKVKEAKALLQKHNELDTAAYRKT